MSIRKMIGLHPDVQGHVNQPLADAAHHLMYCARMCLSCADACAAEKMDMVQCIRLCLDCSDVCEAAGKLAVRRTASLPVASQTSAQSRQERMHCRMSSFSAAQASAQLTHIRAQYIR